MGSIKITIKPNPRLHAQVKGTVAHIQNGTIQAEIKRLKEICASFPPVKILLNKKTK